MQQSVTSTSRLHLPASFEEEGLHSGAWGGTLFPGPVGLGATWDEGLLLEIGKAIAVEARAAGVDSVFVVHPLFVTLELYECK